MKAVVYHQYGSPDVLQVAEIEKPTPNENQILLKVHAVSINAADYRPLSGKPFLIRLMMGGIFKPKDPRIGIDVAGRVEAVGANVKRFRPGDEVFGCANGALAEYVLAKEKNLARKPAHISFEEAAAVPVAALTALQGFRYVGGVRPEQKVLIQGASGGVGIFAVQMAKMSGAEVTAVCSTRNLNMVRSFGTDHVIDYMREDFTQNGKKYDLIFAVNGYHPLSAYQRSLTPQGTYVCAGGTFPQIFQAMLLGRFMSKKGGKTLSSMGISNVNQDDMDQLAKLLQEGKIFPVIDRCYPLPEIVPAFRHVMENHAQGKVVVTVEHPQAR
ncbi:MAG TPA: NAD(P)-dependent alcohol dehydrogenase [Anaerolineales bacterium]|nr:NAD(P)-dependent alcohol dehydrogenase [Anaerolineales bacterium]